MSQLGGGDGRVKLR